jgi:hypothetical protein
LTPATWHRKQQYGYSAAGVHLTWGRCLQLTSWRDYTMNKLLYKVHTSNSEAREACDKVRGSDAVQKQLCTF